MCSHPNCGERVASITFPRQFGTDRDVCIVFRSRFVCLHCYLFESRLIKQYRCIFLSWFETLFRRQCPRSNGAQIGHGILYSDSWYILRANSSILTDRLLLFNFGNRVFCFLLFLSRLRDWPILKSEENRDDFVWCCKLSTIWCDFGGWNRSSVRHNCWILQMTGHSSYNVAWSRPTSDLKSHEAVTTDTMHLVVVPWGCIDSWQVCPQTTKRVAQNIHNCSSEWRFIPSARSFAWTRIRCVHIAANRGAFVNCPGLPNHLPNHERNVSRKMHLQMLWRPHPAHDTILPLSTTSNVAHK